MNYYEFTRYKEFFQLTDLTAQQALIPVQENQESTKHNFSIKDGICWNYFPGNFALKNDYITPWIHRRITQMVTGVVRSVAMIVYHLFLITFNMFSSALTWKDWGKQSAFCLGRYILEMFSHLLLPFHHQYARLFIDHHRLQRFCLLNLHHKHQMPSSPLVLLN